MLDMPRLIRAWKSVSSSSGVFQTDQVEMVADSGIGGQEELDQVAEINGPGRDGRPALMRVYIYSVLLCTRLSTKILSGTIFPSSNAFFMVFCDDERSQLIHSAIGCVCSLRPAGLNSHDAHSLMT